MRISRTTALVIMACAAVAACTTNPYTGEEQASKAATYGLGAAAVCGLAGSLDSSKKARNAALGCGIVGRSRRVLASRGLQYTRVTPGRRRGRSGIADGKSTIHRNHRASDKTGTGQDK